MNNQSTEHSSQDNNTEGYQGNYFGFGHIIRWVGISLIIIAGMTYLAYHLGSNENIIKINQLNKDINQLRQVSSLDALVTEFQSISENLKLSSNERSRLTELLDQIIQHKTNLKQAESELQQTKLSFSNITTRYKNQIAQLETENTELKAQLKKVESAMSYSHGTVKNFSISVNDSYSMLSEPTSRIGLQRILNNGSAQIYVGNALMFFHIGHTLRFRFAPNWLCDVTLIKIDDVAEKVEFEYVCKLNN